MLRRGSLRLGIFTDIALKKIDNLKDKLQAYDNNDHAGMVSNQYCEGIVVGIISLRENIEKSDKQNEELLQEFEEQENGLKEEILKLKQ